MGLKRMNWQEYLYGTYERLQEDQTTMRALAQNIRIHNHTYGIVYGASVLATSPTPDLIVHAQVGWVVDQAGKEIILSEIFDVNLTAYTLLGEDTTVYIVAEFDETQVTPYVVAETGEVKYAYQEETPTVTAQTAAPSPSGNQVELARVLVGAAAVAISNAGDPLAPAKSQINLRSRVYSFARPQGTPVLHQPVVYGWDTAADAAPKYRLEWFAGWKVLDPNNGTVAAQLTALGVAAGDRFWMLPGTYTFGASVDISVDDVIITGGRGVIVNMAAYKLTLSGDNCKVEGINLHVTADSTTVPVVVISGNEGKLLDVEIDDDGSHYRLYAVHILNTASRCLIDQCIIDGVANTGSNPGAIMFETGGTNKDCRITRCDITLLASAVFAICGTGSATACGVSENRITFPATGAAIQAIRLYSLWKVSKNIITGHASVTTGVGVISASADVTDFTVEDNFITLCTSAGVSISGATNSRARIRDNTITECLYGVYCSSASTYFSVEHNKIISTTIAYPRGVKIVGTYSVVEGNVIALAGTTEADGIEFTGSYNKAIGNDIVVSASSGYGSTGISIDGDSLADGNYVSADDGGADSADVWTRGITASGSNIRIVGNSFKTESSNATVAIPAYCILLSGVTESIVEGNYCAYTGGGAAGSQGILVSGDSDRLVIQGNHVYTGFEANEGINADGAVNSVVAGNVLKSAIQGVAGAGTAVNGDNVAI